MSTRAESARSAEGAGDVGILTFHCSDNFGAMLQAYGLKRFLRERGVRPPGFMSGNVDGGDAYNRAVIAEHAENIFYM